MKRNIVIFVPVIVVAAAFLLAFMYSTAIAPTTPAQGGTSAARGMSIEQYVTENINELSPEKAVLGGTFRVTEIEADGGVGKVQYEDGHIALEADFTYTIDEARGGITVTSFIVNE